MMEATQQALLQQWQVITTAPFFFVSAVVAVGGVMFAVMKWLFRHQLDNKDSTIALLTLTLNQLQEQNRAREKADGLAPQVPPTRREALVLLLGNRDVLREFLKLTTASSTTTFTWSESAGKRTRPRRPVTAQEVKEFAAIHTLIGQGHVSATTSAPERTMVAVSDQGRRVRAAMDDLRDREL
jgi:hypothetical protein